MCVVEFSASVRHDDDARVSSRKSIQSFEPVCICIAMLVHLVSNKFVLAFGSLHDELGHCLQMNASDCVRSLS